MPSSQYEIDSRHQFYTCHTQVLTLPRDELPLIRYFSLGELVRSSFHFIASHWGDCNHWRDWVEAYNSYDPHLWENLSINERRKRILWFKIIEFLKGMPLVEAKHRRIACKIFNALVRGPRQFGRTHKGVFVDVDIYHELVPCAAAATEWDLLLKDVRLDRLCCICREDFDKDVTATRLPCSHIFHGHCLFRWLEKSHKCPLCREPIFHHDQISVIRDSTTGCKHSYYGKVDRKVCAPSRRSRTSSDELRIQFNLYKSNGVGCMGHYGDVERYNGVEKIQPESESQLLTIPNRHREQLQPTMIKQVLKSMGVPSYEQLPIVAKIFEVAANNNFDDGHAFINVDIYEETLSLVDLGNYMVIKGSRTTKVAIEELERVKLHKSCGICKDDFDDGVLASRFPCLHIFHTDCTHSWLETDHKCPLCRYPLQIYLY